MLGDNSEKSKNPLKKAMRRRNAKTVNFAAPTYIEASDVEYSTDEDDEHGDFFNDDETVESEDGEAQEQNEDIVVEPLRPKGQKEKSTEQTEATETEEKSEPERSISDPRRSSEELFDPEGMQKHPFSEQQTTQSNFLDQVEPAVSRSRKGTVRNTDSFFKDDTAEPKKISLTPNLLRDESNNSSNSLLNEWKEGRGSFESIDKASTSQEKTKDDKKRKDKKPGMLSGLFKRGKKSKSTDEDVDEPLSPAESSFRTSPKTSMESTMSQESRTKPQRQTSNRLQKQPPATMSPTSPTEQTKDIETVLSNQAGRSIRKVTTTQEVESFEEDHGAVTSPTSQSSPSKESFATPLESRDPFASPEDRPPSEAQWRGPYGPDRAATGQPSVTSPPQRFTPTMGTRYYDGGSESPVNISPVDGHIPISAPGLTPDTTYRGQFGSPVSPPSSPEADSHDPKETDAAQGSLDTLSVDTPTWSDASLRSYMDEENDIRDLFIIVHDKSNIPPAGPEHPVTGRLFKEESKRLKEMNNQLDNMLVKWMAQRARRNSMRSVQSPTA